MSGGGRRSSALKVIVPVKWIGYGFGYVIIRYPIFYLLKGDYNRPQQKGCHVPGCLLLEEEEFKCLPQKWHGASQTGQLVLGYGLGFWSL